MIGVKTSLYRPLGVFVAVLLLIASQQAAVAHIGNVPVALINGDPVTQKANNGLALSKAQDFAPKSYVVNQQLTFAVDTKVFGDGYYYRWQLNPDVPQYVESSQLLHTFDKPGTYIVSVEIKGNGISDYVQADSVALNVMPRADYTLPSITGKKTALGNNKIKFEATPVVDKSTQVKQIKWEFDDDVTAEGAVVEHEYPGRVTGPYGGAVVHIVDANGLYADKVVEVLTSDLSAGSAHPPKASTSKPKKPFSKGLMVVIIGGVLTAAVLFLAFFNKPSAADGADDLED